MRERLGLRRWQGQQDLGRAPVQRLAAALQQAVVGGVLDQRVLEAIVRVRRDAFDEQQLGVGEPVERGAQRRLAISPTMRATSPASSGASEITP
jgi:hypothetical protein